MWWDFDLKPLYYLAIIGLIAVGLAVIAFPFLLWWAVQHISIGWA